MDARITLGKEHHYAAGLVWTGNWGEGTRDYRCYGREHRIESGRKPTIAGSSDPNFRGDADCWNPEELLVASLAACHQLWYLSLCSQAGIVVTSYRDEAIGSMTQTADGSGQFTHVLLRPVVTVSSGCDLDMALKLHDDAHQKCFIAKSVNFDVQHDATVVHDRGSREACKQGPR